MKNIKESVKETIQKIGERNSRSLARSFRCSRCAKEFEPDETSPDICPVCNEVIEKERRQEYAREGIRRLIPKKYQDIETAREDLLDRSLGKSLFVCGSVGIGKTVFMASLAKHYLREGNSIKWLSYPAFIMVLQRAFGKDQTASPYDEAEKVARFEGCLFIDDLGAEKLTDFVRQITYYIINEREQRMLQTAITSNFSLEEIDEFVDRRISSRISGMCEILKFKGEDRRLNKLTM